jgi:hypothetical protein
MGGSESKSTVKTLSKQITDIAISTVQTCETNSRQSQTVNVANTGFKLWGSYKMEQETDISVSCFNDTQKQTDLQNKLISTISQTNSANGVAIISAFGSSSTNAKANLTNIIRNNITMSNIQKTYNSIRQAQTINFSNSGVVLFEQADLMQGSKLFAASVLKEIDKAGIFNSIENKIDQENTATTSNPLDFISDILSGISMSIIIIIMAFILVIFAISVGAYFILRSGEETKGETKVET